MMKRYKISFLLVLAALVLSWGYFIGKGFDCSTGEVRSDTVTFVDTIPFIHPVPKDSFVVKYITRYFPLKEVPDSIKAPDVQIAENKRYGDSAEVVIPITSKKYEDSLYTAYVSGYNANLDSIFVKKQTTVITNTQTRIKLRRFGVGINVGIGYGTTSKHVEPYIGIGATYIIW